jgi:divalent metal cation (Fe/Co/Zn/Cd) transporter
MSLEEAHLVSHSVSKRLKDEFKDISDVVIHLEPSLHQPEESNSKKAS